MKKLSLVVLTIILGASVNAQELLSPSYSFSHRKTSYITLDDGVEIKGTLTAVKRKKGLIKKILIKDGTNTKHKLKPSSIKFMYLPPTNFDKLNKALEFLHDAKKWNDEKLNQDFLNQGYIYFETVNVKIKKRKTLPLLMQLLNPTFSKKVKVYHDARAKKTASFGVGVIKIVGGIAKSYYMKFANDPAAYRLKKNKYAQEFVALWNKCSDLAKITDIKWKDLTSHIIKYSECE